MNEDGYVQKGVASLGGRISPAIAERIERLGKLNDEHKELVVARDREGLLRLAQKYLMLKHPCTVMARAITVQAESISPAD